MDRGSCFDGRLLFYCLVSLLDFRSGSLLSFLLDFRSGSLLSLSRGKPSQPWKWYLTSYFFGWQKKMNVLYMSLCLLVCQAVQSSERTRSHCSTKWRRSLSLAASVDLIVQVGHASHISSILWFEAWRIFLLCLEYDDVQSWQGHLVWISMSTSVDRQYDTYRICWCLFGDCSSGRPTWLAVRGDITSLYIWFVLQLVSVTKYHRTRSHVCT